MKCSLYTLLASYRKMLRFILWLMLMLGNFTGYGQSKLPLGGWQLHVPYQQGKAVADAGDRVYLAAERGLFYFDKEFNSIHTLSKADGLREQEISTIAYDHGTATLVIAYASTNIDLLRQNKLIPISDIFRKAIPGSKRINHIYLHNRLAYVSCSFGVVVLDLQKLEIRDTYANLGTTGEEVSIKAATILGDSIYIATATNVLAAKRTNTNLQDFRNWQSITNGLPENSSLNALASFNGKIYAGTSVGLFKLSGKVWQHVTDLPASAEITSLNASERFLSLTTTGQALVLDKANQVYALSNELIKLPAGATTTQNGTVWVADRTNGLIRASINTSDAAAFAPDGPFSGSSFRAYIFADTTIILSGGYTSDYTPAQNQEGFYKYTSEGWQNVNKYTFPNSAVVSQAKDVVDAVYNSVTRKLYIASYGSGLLEWENPEKNKLYNQTNSPLRSTNINDAVLVPDVEADAEGNVWIVNQNQLAGAPGLHSLAPDGSWKSFVIPVSDGSSFEHLLLDDAGHKWLSFARNSKDANGLVVFDAEKNKVRRLATGAGNGGLPHNSVYSMAKDMNGDIWVGTANGVAVFYNPAYLFEQQTYDARIPIIDRRPLLDGRTVRTIAIDGANRKWMGTGDGLWLFGADGDELIQHFTSNNSSLPSDKILSVSVNHTSGEVFVATDKGLASYRAAATKTEGKPACAVIFPNPVQRSYTGQVGISGLPNNAQVRITDIAGTLVYKTTAIGGSLAWNIRDYNGKRVKTGVYLVMSSDEKGKQTCISKIAVL